MKHNVIEIFLKNKKDAQKNAAAEDSVWNLFVQILLPLILILTFISVILILKYKTKADQADKDLSSLTREYEEVLTELDPQKIREGSKKLILKLQLQKLFRALMEVEKIERESLGLTDYRSVRDVVLDGSKLSDKDFKNFCRKFKNTVLSRQYNIKDQYLRSVYTKILRAAEVRDSEKINFVIMNNQERVRYEFLERVNAVEGVISKSNRLIIASEVLKLANSFKSEMTKLQKDLLLEMLYAKADEEEELDEESRKLIAVMNNTENSEIYDSALEQFYRREMKKIKDNIVEYDFMPDAVREISSIY